MKGYQKILSAAGRIFLAAVFIYGGVPKLLDIGGTAKMVDAYGMLPDILVLPTAIILPSLEIAVAAGLIMGRSWAIYLSFFLYLLFLSVLGVGIAVGLDIDCGCFGPSDPEYTALHGLKTAFVRDLLFMVPVLYLLWYHVRDYFAKRRVVKRATI